MLCLYSDATCSNTSTSNMLSLIFGFITSLTNAKGSWSLGLNASSSLNTRHENRLLATPCFLKIIALSGTSAKIIVETVNLIIIRASKLQLCSYILKGSLTLTEK
ncbi:hypothetical protein Hanom_Chr04g00357991 [Helianthus anomalus]